MNNDQIIKEQIANSAPEIRDYLVKKEWLQVIDNLGQKNGLNPEQKANLENEVLFVLLGMELAINFSENVATNVAGLTQDKIGQIALEIHEQIFKNLEQYLPNRQEGAASNTEPEQPSLYRTLKESELIEQGKGKMSAERKKAVEEVPWREYVQDIAFLNKLSLEQIESFGKEALLVILNLEAQEKFADNLVRETKVAPDIAKSIVEMVDEKILKVIERKEHGEPEPVTPKEIDLEDKETLRSTPNHVLIDIQKSKLPPKELEAINSTPWQEIVKDIALRNKLGIGQAAILEKETLFVLYKLEREEDYHTNITREAELNKDLADPVTNAINLEVFKQIKDRANGVVPASAPIPQAPQNTPVPATIQNSTPPANLPMIENGEVAHDTTPNTVSENKQQVSTPDYRYQGGKDPYKEPLV